MLSPRRTFIHGGFLAAALLMGCQDSPVTPELDAGRAYSVVTPEAPSTVVATTVSAAQIDVSWTDASATENRFKIQRRDYDGAWSTWHVLATLPENATGYSDTDVTTGNTYVYRVRSCNLSGCSAWIKSARAVADVAPAAPRNLTVGALTSASNVIRFEDMSQNETRFVLMRRSRAEDEPWYPWHVIATMPANTTTHTDSNVTPHGFYEYRVRACNAAGCSVWVRH